MQYVNTTQKVQTINLRSGESLYASPKKVYPLSAGDEFSTEISANVRSRKGRLVADPPKPETVSSAEPKSATLGESRKKKTSTFGDNG